MSSGPRSIFEALAMMEALTGELSPPKAKGFNREGVREIEFVDRIIPASTLYFFLDFALEGNLYTGEKCNLPLLAEDEVPLLGTPYAFWASPPWNTTSSSLQERLLKSPDRLNVVVKGRISCMRARLWEGMIPMSGSRWKEKKLHEPKNWQFAFDFMHDIYQTFRWLGDPDIQKLTRDGFNYVAQELETFQHALNARRARNGVAEMIDMRKLWLNFVHSIFETMVTRTHCWVLDRVNEIVANEKAAYDAVADAKGAVDAHEAAKDLLEAWSDLNRTLHLCDWMIMMPMDGFAGFSAPMSDTKVVGSMFPMPFRRDQREELAARIHTPVMEGIMTENKQALYTNRDTINAMLKESKDMNDRVRLQLRGEPRPLGREHWISIIHSRTHWSLSHGGPQDQRWGFVAYMLTHTPSKEQWDLFFQKVNADFERSGEWVEGFDEVRPNMALQWIDAKEVGIPHDDIQATKRHFQAFASSSQKRKRAWNLDFLVVDSECFGSYMTPSPSHFQGEQWTSHGDYGGFFKLIDTTTNNPQVIAKQAPGYKNELKVLGSLVFDDLYPMLASLVQRPRDLWLYAVWHPNTVYVGPCVERQEKEWDRVWQTRALFMRVFWKWRSEQSASEIRACEAPPRSRQYFYQSIARDRYLPHLEHEVKYIRAVKDLSDSELASFLADDLDSVRVATSAYGLHLFAKARFPAASDAYIHLRIFGSAKEGTDGSSLDGREYKLHSIHTEEVQKGDDKVYRAIFTKNDALE